MPTQTGTLKAGYQLVIDSQGSQVDYDVSVTGYAVDFKRVQQKNTLSLGPYKVDCSYSVTVNSGSTVIYKVQPNGQREYISTALPDPAYFDIGTVISVDGNAAIVSGGQIKYITPFRTTWEARPAASSVMAGAELQVTDYGNRKWISDGVNWLPAQGVVILYDLFGLNDGTGHIAQISGATSGTFAIPGGLKIPAGMIRSGAKISVQAEITKVGGNGAASATITLGTLNAASDSNVSGQPISTGTGMQALMTCAARFGASTTKFNTRDYVGEGVSQASVANVMKDRTSNINTAADMWVNVNISAANAGDVFNLIGIQVKLES